MKIPIKRFVDDPSLPWEERFKRLLAHHEEETKWMFEELKRLEQQVKYAQTRQQ